MEKGKIAILKGEIDAQTKEIENIYAKIRERAKGKTRADLEGLSLWLHHLYCAFEGMFEMIARMFENNIDERGQYHIELLKRMMIQIDGVRPAFLSDEAFKLLDNLRAFRRVLRHSYVYDIDERKTKLVLEDALKLEKIYKRDIKDFFEKFR